MSHKEQISVLKIVLAALLIPVEFILGAYIVMLMWSWFVVPLGAVAIGKAHAYGINCLAKALTWRRDVATKENRGYCEILASAFIQPLLLLAAAYIAHRLM